MGEEKQLSLMERNIELLAPGGDINSIKAAIAAGADAVYCGLNKFNARNRGTNISFEDLNGILGLAHKNNCQVFLTLNIIIVESEIAALFNILNKLANTSIDGIIIQDLGMLYLVSNYFKRLKIHASTQLTTHNEGQLHFLKKLSATRVNLSRELNIKEIKALSLVSHKNEMLIEVFVHGSNCICFSGLCYISSVHGGNSGNRGRCSQPCRDQYVTTPEGKNFPLNLKDNSAWSDLRELSETGVDSVKIEGRIKKFHYVYTITDAWRKQLQSFYVKNKLLNNKSALYKVFNRDFSNDFLKGTITKELFIDNPRDNSAIYSAELKGGHTDENIEKAKGEIYDERAEMISNVENVIDKMSISKAPLDISLSGDNGSPLKVSVKTPDHFFVLDSKTNLVTVAPAKALTYGTVFSKLKALNDTEYYIRQLDMNDLQPDVYLSFNELTSIKKRLLLILNDSRETVDAIPVPALKRQTNAKTKPTLKVLLSSPDDLYLCDETSAQIHFQLPNCLRNVSQEYSDIFIKNRTIIPWFPAVLIGDDYRAAVEFLHLVKPERIVTNNTGIAYEAYKNGISWIAGPQLNIVNSFSLICLKENFNCAGAYISNEISRNQIQQIKKPEDFELYYSIYHPVVLMTSRQCLFHQVTGCEKDKIDDNCIQHCKKSSFITSLKEQTLIIEKSASNYHTIYNEHNFLNTEIVTDLPDFFTGFLINLSDISTGTRPAANKPTIIKLFENLLDENPEAETEINKIIYPTGNAQYRNGI